MAEKKISNRAERKSRQNQNREESRQRILGWGRKKLRIWWNSLIRKAEDNQTTKIDLARLKAAQRAELAESQLRFSPLLEEKNKRRIEVLKEYEFRRYRRYMRKCEYFMNRKHNPNPCHKAELERCKTILFGSLVSPDRIT